MKYKLIVIFLCLGTLLSCDVFKEKKKETNSTEAKDINVDRLKKACDFADAQLIVMKEMKEIADANKDVKDIKDLKIEDQEKVEVLMQKLMEISEALEKAKIKDEDIKKCDAYKEMEKMAEEMENE